MKNNNFISGKASLVILLAVLALSFGLLLNSLTKVFAEQNNNHDNNNDYQGQNDNNNHDNNNDNNHDKDCKDRDGHFLFSFDGKPGHDQKDCKDQDPKCSEGQVLNSDHRCVTPTPVESSTPAPTATPGDVCWNLDGFQGSIPDGFHKDTPDGACNQYAFGGPPAPPSVTGSGTGGQVLGASTMAGTGSFDENLYMAVMGIGAAVTFAGVKKAFK